MEGMWSCGKTFSVASAHLAMRSSFLIKETTVTWPLAAWHYGIKSSFTPTCTHTPAVCSCLGSCSSWCLCETCICWEEVLLLSCAFEAIGLAFLYGSWFTSDSQQCLFKPGVNPLLTKAFCLLIILSHWAKAVKLKNCYLSLDMLVCSRHLFGMMDKR